jgi:aminomethyltransferase
MSTTLQSPLLDLYKAAGSVEARDGCPVLARFDSLADEYRRLRQGIGLTDHSHYGKFQLAGPAALDVANRLAVGDVSRLPIKRALFSFILNPDGSVLCDLYVLNRGDSYLLLTEGAEPARVRDVLTRESTPLGGSVTVTDLTGSTALIGLEGPFAWELLKELIGVKILGVRYLGVMEDQAIGDVPATILRGGKTGEYGYLLVTAAGKAAGVWNRLLEAGKDFHLQPCGHEALDVCRLENRFINLAKEGRQAKNILELNCRILVAHDKENYIGQEEVAAARTNGIRRRLIGLTIGWPAGGDPAASLPPVGAEVQYQGARIGELANASYSYLLSQHIGVAFLEVDYAYVGLDYELKAGGTTCPARTVSAPFILNRSATIRPQEDSYRT